MRPVKQPIFLLGTGRSGTTLTGMLLSMHKDVAYLNEPKAIWHSVYPYEDIVGNYSDAKAFYRLNKAQVQQAQVTNLHKIYGFYLTILRKQRLLDKYPELIFRVDFVKQIFPDAKFLVMVRNGWDTASSIEAWSHQKGRTVKGDVENWWGKNDRKWSLLLDEIVLQDTIMSKYYDHLKLMTCEKNKGLIEWILAMKEAISVQERYPTDVQLIHYEDLVENPQSILREVFEFHQLRYDNSVIKYADRVVRKSNKVSRFDIDKEIFPHFDHIMSKLGYSSG